MKLASVNKAIVIFRIELKAFIELNNRKITISMASSNF